MEEPKIVVNKDTYKELGVQLVARVRKISTKTESQELVNELERCIKPVIESGVLTKEHFIALMQFFKKFDLSSCESVDAVLEQNMAKAGAKAALFKKSKPYQQKLKAIPLIKEFIRATSSVSPKVRSFANIVRLPIVAEAAEEILKEVETMAYPVGKQLIVSPFVANYSSFSRSYGVIGVRLAIVYAVFNYLKPKLEWVDPQSSSNGFTIESGYWKLTDTTDLFPKGASIPEVETDKTLLKDLTGKVAITKANFLSYLGACIVISPRYLCQTSDYRVAQARKGDLDGFKGKMFGLMDAVILMMDPELKNEIPTRNIATTSDYCKMFFEQFSVLKTTMRMVFYALFEQKGGADTKSGKTNFAGKIEYPAFLDVRPDEEQEEEAPEAEEEKTKKPGKPAAVAVVNSNNTPAPTAASTPEKKSVKK